MKVTEDAHKSASGSTLEKDNILPAESKGDKMVRAVKKLRSSIQQGTSAMPVIQSVSSLASVGENQCSKNKGNNSSKTSLTEKGDQKKVDTSHKQVQTMIDALTQTKMSVPESKEVRNKAVMTRPVLMAKAVNCPPSPGQRKSPTESPENPSIVPLGVPCYMPVPLPMYQKMYPVLVPFPLPIPVPVLVPTTKKSYDKICKKIQKMRSQLPDNPFEAELLSLAGSATYDGSDSDDSQPDLKKPRVQEKLNIENMSPLTVADPTVTNATIPGINDSTSAEWENRKKIATQQSTSRKKGKHDRDEDMSNRGIKNGQLLLDKPDAKHHLKFSYGVNAWAHWIEQKNKSIAIAREEGECTKYLETDILKLRADELNYTLCMFVKEATKPNGESYAADSILYLTYGIQEYLFEKGRLDNIFTDQYYDAFTSALHEIVKDFKLPRNELGYFVTRIEEEHLWETRQLGVHSPQVLLNTLVYFNTKYFMLRNTSDHLKLSFNEIIKQWKKDQDKKDGQKLVVLNYRPLYKKGQRNEDTTSFDMQENAQNPMRCPVHLFQFYLSKCPQAAKCQSNLFYLLPEKSCTPDSPVWFESTSLNENSIDKMLQRCLMVREVQEQVLIRTSEKQGLTQ